MKNNNLEEIISYIVDNYLFDLIYDELDIPNVSFDFKEKEARDLINKIIINNMDKNFNKKCKIYDAINNVDYDNPVIEIKDYKLFFLSIDRLTNAIYDICNNKIKYEREINRLSFKSLLKYIWLRMTPDDFKNPEKFLLKNIEMAKNNLFDEYYNKSGYLLNLDEEHKVCFKNKVSSAFDEENKEMLFYVKSKKDERDYLPIIRYGIYNDGNKDICEIGSIQSKHHTLNDNKKYVNSLRGLINKNVPGELKQNVEPKKVISLLFFIKLLQDNNIHELSIPSMFVLDYRFHEIWYQNDYECFVSRWTDYRQKLYPEEYKEAAEYFKDNLIKSSVISANKTTNFIKLFERLIYHIPEIEILEYPNELSSYMRLRVPNNNSVEEVIRKLKKS